MVGWAGANSHPSNGTFGPIARIDLHFPTAQGRLGDGPLPCGHVSATPAHGGYRVYIFPGNGAHSSPSVRSRKSGLYSLRESLLPPSCVQFGGKKLARPNIGPRPSMRLKSLSLLRIILVGVFRAHAARARALRECLHAPDVPVNLSAAGVGISPRRGDILRIR